MFFVLLVQELNCKVQKQATNLPFQVLRSALVLSKKLCEISGFIKLLFNNCSHVRTDWLISCLEMLSSIAKCLSSSDYSLPVSHRANKEYRITYLSNTSGISWTCWQDHWFPFLALIHALTNHPADLKTAPHRDCAQTLLPKQPPGPVFSWSILFTVTQMQRDSGSRRGRPHNS